MPNVNEPDTLVVNVKTAEMRIGLSLQRYLSLAYDPSIMRVHGGIKQG
jgi:hypothetical protein